jgi:hypothetical protein
MILVPLIALLQDKLRNGWRHFTMNKRHTKSLPAHAGVLPIPSTNEHGNARNE